MKGARVQVAEATVTQPHLVRFVDAHLEVQLDGVARGVVVADRHAGDVNARIAVAVDAEGFREHLTSCLRRLPAVD